MREKVISNKIIKHINKQYAETTYLYKRLSDSNQIGMPDITGSHNGIRVELEVKTPERTHMVSRHQSYWLNKFKAIGCITGVVTSLEEALIALDVASEQQSD